MQASPTVAGGVVYVGGNNGNLYALDAISGSELWHYNTGSPIVSAVTIDHGVLYLGLRAGAIIALGTPDFITPQPTPTPTPTLTRIQPQHLHQHQPLTQQHNHQQTNPPPNSHYHPTTITNTQLLKHHQSHDRSRNTN